jgi:hypothetical protein
MSRFQVTIRERDTELTIFTCPLFLWSYIGYREGRDGSGPRLGYGSPVKYTVIFESTGIIGVNSAITHHVIHIPM